MTFISLHKSGQQRLTADRKNFAFFTALLTDSRSKIKWVSFL